MSLRLEQVITNQISGFVLAENVTSEQRVCDWRTTRRNVGVNLEALSPGGRGLAIGDQRKPAADGLGSPSYWTSSVMYRYDTTIELAIMGGKLVDTTLDQLQATVLALPEAERARLAEKLLASLDENAEIEAAWRAEVRDRLAAYERGDLAAVSADDVLAKARKIVGR